MMSGETLTSMHGFGCFVYEGLNARGIQVVTHVPKKI
jgi:hypothetical protein